jgi:hypothetical protein
LSIWKHPDSVQIIAEWTDDNRDLERLSNGGCHTNISSACKSSLKTGKRLELDRTGLEKNWTAFLVFDI